MKNKLTELDVDFIGRQEETLTQEEELLISQFILADKKKRRPLFTSRSRKKTAFRATPE